MTTAAFSVCRYNFGASTAEIVRKYAFSRSEVAVILSLGFWAYTVAALCNGPLADRFGGRRALLVSAAGVIATNLMIGAFLLTGWQTAILVALTLFHALNQYFQSFNFLAVTKINSHWFHVNERGFYGGLFGGLRSFIDTTALFLGAWALSKFPLPIVFLVPALILAALFLHRIAFIFLIFILLCVMFGICITIIFLQRVD
jgi:OPA family glycerol-3-phosphate transporter-like MFS transporter